MTMKYYHATPAENCESIDNQGLKPSNDGIVYLADREELTYFHMMIKDKHKKEGKDKDIDMIALYVIDGDKLDRKKFKRKLQYKKSEVKIIKYADTIPPEALTWIHTIPIEVLYLIPQITEAREAFKTLKQST
ncbi:hypothetical protein [Jeotgalicoccus psychrophilus]|uniref:hypothetical protein n=1 Tax=Jeotgalicoccus psychrophilus TaxID=157228 RepID=UPI0003FFB101|nr:hypothetical protein [Jeotgalicoccus psychrophilus]